MKPDTPSHHSNKRITIKDVAQAAGVSVTTVSNALNERTEAMSEETLVRIQAAIKTLGYRRNNIARSLVTSHTRTIGVIIAEIETPLFLQALNVIEPAARHADYNIVFCAARSMADERQALNLLLQKQVDGIIFLSTSLYIDDDYLAAIGPADPPIVLINRTTIHKQFDHVHWNNTQGTIDSVDYLVGLGHRHIGFMRGPDSRRSSAERIQGYQTALRAHGLPYRPDYVVLGDYFVGTPAEWEEVALHLLDVSPRPTAIIASNDTVATVVMRAVQRAGLRIPEDVSVLGNDNQPFSPYLNPALTTVEVPVVQTGQWAIETLLARVADTARPIEQVTMPCALIVRESSGPAC